MIANNQELQVTLDRIAHFQAQVVHLRKVETNPDNYHAEENRMTRYWTCHWRNRYWKDGINREDQPIVSSGSNSFTRKGVSIGDVVYIVSMGGGQLYLGGRMRVAKVTSRDEAVQILQRDNLYDADEWIIGDKQSGTPLNLHRRLAPDVSRQLRFRSPRSEPKGLFFVSDTHLDVQATRGVRELTSDSATLLDRIITVTDQLPQSDEITLVSEELLQGEVASKQYP